MSEDGSLAVVNNVCLALHMCRILNMLLHGVRSPRWTGMRWEVEPDDSRPDAWGMSLYEIDCDDAGDYEVEYYPIAADTTRLQIAGYAKAAMEITIDYITNYGQGN